MGRIVRLTESDLARIVRRVINEQVTTPIIDGGIGRDLREYVAVYSQPTVTGGSGYKGVITAQVKFSGMRFGFDGKLVAKGNIVLYAGCGKPLDGRMMNPANLSPRSSSDVFEGGSTYVFSKGGVVDKAVRAFCAKSGQPSSQTAGGVMPDLLAGVKAAAAEVK